MKEGFIQPLNPQIDFKFIPLENNPGQAQQYPEKEISDTWFYSSNNCSSNRDKFYSLGMQIKNIPKFEAEISAFAGNIFRLLLSGPHPEYYACQILTEKNPSYSYVRVCKGISGFTPWKDCVKVSSLGMTVFDQDFSWENIEKIPVNGMTSMLVAGLFLTESDWSNTNFGLVQGVRQVIRIDPGLSLDNDFLDNNESDIFKKLSHLLLNFVYKMEENYFPEFSSSTTHDRMEFSDTEDNPVADLINDQVNHLFQSETELFETLYKIVTLTEEDYFITVQKNSSGEFQAFWDNFLGYFKDRIYCFKIAAMELDGFEEYFSKKNYERLVNEAAMIPHQMPHQLAPSLTHFSGCRDIQPLQKCPSVVSSVTTPVHRTPQQAIFVPGPSTPGLWRYPHILNPATSPQTSYYNFFRQQAEMEESKFMIPGITPAAV